MAGGCTTCHNVQTDGKKTTITLLAPAPQLCQTCHSPIEGKVKHEPYEKGQCLFCHNPHSSNYIAHTRAPTNKLCLGCHGERKVTAANVPLFDGKAVPVAEFEAAPKLQLDPSGRVGHPFLGHPVKGYPDPFHKGQPFSCVSCHSPHATAMEYLLTDMWKSVKVCDQCHQAVKKAAKEAKPAKTKP
jgi:predicted CXXCH cytochrome family protein